MHIQRDIPEPLYAEFAQAAAASGRSVEAAMVDQLAANFSEELPANFWTPERLAELRAADADIDAGDFFTVAQVEAQLAANRATWLQTHPL